MPVKEEMSRAARGGGGRAERRWWRRGGRGEGCGGAGYDPHISYKLCSKRHKQFGKKAELPANIIA